LVGAQNLPGSRTLPQQLPQIATSNELNISTCRKRLRIAR
jgi:hypothetical protein